MKLIFRIINNPKIGSSIEDHKVFDSNLATIGRSQNSDWVLPDPERFISSKHAEIHFRNNSFYIKDISSNGIINSATDEAIGKNQEQPISNGQNFLIGDYLIQAELESSPNQAISPDSQAIADEHAEWENQMDDFWGNSSDPLDLLASNQGKTDSNTDSNAAMPSLANSIERTPAFKQAMSFAPNESSTTAVSEVEGIKNDFSQQVPSSSGIPENWDNTSFSLPEKAVAKPLATHATPTKSVKPQPALATTNEFNPDISEDDDFFQGLETDDFFNESDNTDSLDIIKTGKIVDIPPSHAQPVKQALNSSANFSRPDNARPRKRSTLADDSNSQLNLNNKLIESAKAAFTKQGLDEKLLTEESALQWLELMPTVIQGTLDLLQARAAIKNEFRVSKTLLNISENNPLKFSVNAEDAILSLFHQNRPGFQSAKPAFEQAFSDINIHQSALLHGVRVAMMSLLKQFDAEQLEKDFSDNNQSSNFLDKLGTSKSAQAKLWQQYKDLYNNEFKIDSDDSFQRIFGENFADAYSEFDTDR